MAQYLCMAKLEREKLSQCLEITLKKLENKQFNISNQKVLKGKGNNPEVRHH